MSLELQNAKNTQQYRPSEGEEYMNSEQLKYFKGLLESWKESLLEESKQTIDHFKEENWQEPDVADIATVEIEASLELKTRDRYRKLIDKIEQALSRIKDGSYGYCEDTGENIGIKTFLIPALCAANNFSFRPPIGSTNPLKVISPVIATFLFTGISVIAEIIDVTIPTPAEGPSLGVAPSGT